MNIETMKSVILVILIAFSLMLTVALWNYQPAIDTVEEDGVIEDTTLDDIGKEQSLQEIVEPERIIFQEQDLYYSYLDPRDKVSFFNQMKDWNLSNLEENPDPVSFEGQDKVAEVIFPTQLPLQVIKDIFTVESERIESMSYSFDRIFLVHYHNEQSPSSYEVWFINSTGNGDAAKLSATINGNYGERVLQELEDKEELQQQVRLADAFPLEEAESAGLTHIYFPKESVSIPEVVLQTNAVPVKPLQNDLFPPTSLVSRYYTNGGDQRLTTAERRLDVLDHDRRMEYVYMIPNRANPSYLGEYELLVNSLEDINGHLGWTNNFRIDSISSRLNKVEYKMYYNDLPILGDTSQLAAISLNYEQGVIQGYSRPLVQFNPYDNDNQLNANLSSGEEVLDFLRETNEYHFEDIEDIQIGYELTGQTPSNLAYNLTPKWYIKISGSWDEISMDGISQNEEVS